jgi:RNA-directed DNA polymerase
MVDGVFEESPEGVPQGGPLSPLLGNIMLNEYDQELERRGHRFVRYADDMLILCRSRRAAERTLTSITKFLEQKLFLKVNREKTKVDHVRYVKFLGYGFYRTKGEARLRVHSNRRQRGIGDVGQYKEGLLAHRQQPNPEHLTLQRTLSSNGLLEFF